jgi:hypothetical protein
MSGPSLLDNAQFVDETEYETEGMERDEREEEGRWRDGRDDRKETERWEGEVIE